MVRTRFVGIVVVLYLCALVSALIASPPPPLSPLDGDLVEALSAAGFTGMIQQTYQARLEANLGRPLDPRLAEIGRMLWFEDRKSVV